MEPTLWRPVAGLAVAVVVTALIQAALLSWLLASGEVTTATVLDSKRKPRYDIDTDVRCTRSMTCVLVAFETAEGRRVETWAGRGVPQGFFPSPYARGERVDVVYRECDECIAHVGNDYVVKLRTFEGMWASLAWCLGLACVLGTVAALLKRADPLS